MWKEAGRFGPCTFSVYQHQPCNYFAVEDLPIGNSFEPPLGQTSRTFKKALGLPKKGAKQMKPRSRPPFRPTAIFDVLGRPRILIVFSRGSHESAMSKPPFKTHLTSELTAPPLSRRSDHHTTVSAISGMWKWEPSFPDKIFGTPSQYGTSKAYNRGGLKLRTSEAFQTHRVPWATPTGSVRAAAVEALGHASRVGVDAIPWGFKQPVHYQERDKLARILTDRSSSAPTF